MVALVFEVDILVIATLRGFGGAKLGLDMANIHSSYIP